LVAFAAAGRDQVGVRLGDRVIPVDSLDPELPASVFGLVSGQHLPQLARLVDERGGTNDATERSIPVDDISYLPVVARPGKTLCIGRNYAAHAAEGGADTPTFPEVFVRAATSFVAHRANIVRPQCSDKLDYEGEFAFVVGQTCRHVTEADALNYVAGYTLFNDATVRDYQRAATQWTVGKNFDATGAFGPEFVTADEVPPGLRGLTLRTRLNGEQMQEGHVDDLVFPVARLIAILTEAMTLEAGDVVVTGTPSGVGFARTPPVFMADGDVVEVEIPELGVLTNTVRDEA
jgi:2-keto-4-pentenoate hydratase/2-oxohepta-3-ene-1,7-dioic acid hydratase in catechol pathway